ncbi:MAG TPA: hypothetical protein VEN29_09790 [Casimicrobiaceae bacterium]|nr:hypothetical protein [Casimicrobiaceae bacterium]
MSTDRALNIDTSSELYTEDATEEKLTARGTTSRMDIEFEEYKHLRRAEPACKVLPRTLKWVASLPPNVQPTSLLRHYARIANVIAAAWRHTSSLHSYMDDLLGDKRGARQGFPPEVLRELVALKRYHDSLEASSSPD